MCGPQKATHVMSFFQLPSRGASKPPIQTLKHRLPESALLQWWFGGADLGKQPRFCLVVYRCVSPKKTGWGAEHTRVRDPFWYPFGSLFICICRILVGLSIRLQGVGKARSHFEGSFGIISSRNPRRKPRGGGAPYSQMSTTNPLGPPLKFLQARETDPIGTIGKRKEEHEPLNCVRRWFLVVNVCISADAQSSTHTCLARARDRTHSWGLKVPMASKRSTRPRSRMASVLRIKDSQSKGGIPEKGEVLVRDHVE